MEKQKNSEVDRKLSRVLITGAKGKIGTVLRHALSQDCDVFQLDIENIQDSDVEIKGDIASYEDVIKALTKFEPIDCIVHLASNPNADSSWEDILQANIIGTRNIYEAARQQNVKRVIFASSTHLYGAYEGYPADSELGRPISVEDNPRPDGDYGTSKGFGELIARQYCDLYGIESICLRIGSVSAENEPVALYEKLWLSHNDLVQIFKLALTTDTQFGIYFVTSENRDGIFDLTPTKNELGFKPQDGYPPRR